MMSTPIDVPKRIEELEKLTQSAEEFVTKHFPKENEQGRNIKVLAVVNQLIELERIDVEKGRIPTISEMLAAAAKNK
jgi:hypothetical protein